MQLLIVRDGVEVPAIDIEAVPHHLGRAADNALVISDETVSSQHATIWLEGGRAWIRDQNSRNGTFLNGERIRGAVEIKDGDRVRLGVNAELMVRGSVIGAARVHMALLVEDVDLGVRYPIVGDRFYIGTGAGAHLKLDDSAGEHEAAISLHPDGEIWLATYEQEGAIVADQTFEVGGRRLRVVQQPAAYAPTVEAEASRFPYVLSVTLDGVSGPEAKIEDPREGLEHVIGAENRAILLYVLAKKAVEAKAEGGDSWCADEDVARGIWGRRGSADANSLHVLVHRLRKELKTAGFDPWFIEKRRKAIRIALRDVRVH
jgi:hypothetical protein